MARTGFCPARSSQLLPGVCTWRRTGGGGRKSQRFLQQLGHPPADLPQLREAGPLPLPEGDAPAFRHQGGGGAQICNGVVRRKADEASPNIQAALPGGTAAVEQGDIRGSAADIQVDSGAAHLLGILLGPASLSGDDGLQVRPGGGDHELPGKAAELFQHQGGVFLPGALPGDDNRPGAGIGGGEARPLELGGHQLPHPLPVNEAAVQEGGGMDFTAVDDFFFHDGDLGDGKIPGGVLHGDAAENHLGGGGADVDAYTENLLLPGHRPTTFLHRSDKRPKASAKARRSGLFAIRPTLLWVRCSYSVSVTAGKESSPGTAGRPPPAPPFGRRRCSGGYKAAPRRCIPADGWYPAPLPPG